MWRRRSATDTPVGVDVSSGRLPTSRPRDVPHSDTSGVSAHGCQLRLDDRSPRGLKGSGAVWSEERDVAPLLDGLNEVIEMPDLSEAARRGKEALLDV